MFISKCIDALHGFPEAFCSVLFQSDKQRFPVLCFADNPAIMLTPDGNLPELALL